MTQQPQPDPADLAGDRTMEEGSPETPETAIPVPPAERSRFSQWLASFGLGEFQNPLLTRTRPPMPRRPGRS